MVTLTKAYLKEKYHKPGNVYLGLVHRLDRPVSGVMILARTSKAARRLSLQFKERTTHKHYLALALVEGGLEGEGRWRDFLIKTRGTARVVANTHPLAKAALLSWKTAGHVRGCTLVSVTLHTGRAHQIRCQIAHRGHPVLGDMRYGAERTFDGRNVALHSRTLVVQHPVRKIPVTITAPLPETWHPWVPRLPAGL